MNVLIVVAHPDDEVLGCGATASLLASRGQSVRACILSSHAEARSHRPPLLELEGDICRAQEALGLGKPVLGQFKNVEFNCIPHLELVQFIEAAILETAAQIVFTHHPSDLNDDHRHTARACQAAVRLAQRRDGLRPLKALYLMEVPSSTDWGFGDATSSFNAHSYWEVGQRHVDTKLKALRCYRGVLREYPHPRSEQSIRALATLRGGQAGVDLAEAFESPFRLIGPEDVA